MKILHWDGSGLWVFAKRLEEARFSWPGSASCALILQLEPAALSMLLAGIDLKQGMKKAWCFSEDVKLRTSGANESALWRQRAPLREVHYGSSSRKR